MEHQRNKLRQRAKRRGQCEFPSMDDIMDAFGDGPVQGEVAQRLYSSAHDHMDCILQAEAASPATPTDKRSAGMGRVQIPKAHILQTHRYQIHFPPCCLGSYYPMYHECL